MSRYEFRAMGTLVEAWGDASREATLRAWFEEVEAACSRFQPNSALSRLNRDPSPSAELSGVLLEVVGAAARARERTAGLVDIGVGEAVRAWGYDRTFEDVVGLEEMPTGVAAPDWDLRGERLHKGPGVGFDLGGIAKGWTCDRAVEAGLAEVVSAGGDMRSQDQNTTASVLDPSGEPVVAIRVGVGALATSSVGRRRWRVAGAEVSHLIDPRSMKPVDTPVVSATVVAGSAVDAEVGAKAVLLHGADGLAWAESQAWIGAAVVLWHDGSVFGTPGLEVAA